jgi:hypothetical protein
MKERRKEKREECEAAEGTLPELLEVQRTRVICGPELNYHVCLHLFVLDGMGLVWGT